MKKCIASINLKYLLLDLQIKIHILNAKTHKLTFKAKVFNNLFRNKIVQTSVKVNTNSKKISVQVFNKILILIHPQIKILASHIKANNQIASF